MSKNLIYLIAVLLISCNSFENIFFQYSDRYEKAAEGAALINSGTSGKAKIFGHSCTVYPKRDNNQHRYVSIELNEGLLGYFIIGAYADFIFLTSKKILKNTILKFEKMNLNECTSHSA